MLCASQGRSDNCLLTRQCGPRVPSWNAWEPMGAAEGLPYGCSPGIWYHSPGYSGALSFGWGCLHSKTISFLKAALANLFVNPEHDHCHFYDSFSPTRAQLVPTTHTPLGLHWGAPGCSLELTESITKTVFSSRFFISNYQTEVLKSGVVTLIKRNDCENLKYSTEEP